MTAARPVPVAVEVPYHLGVTGGVSWRWTGSDLVMLVLHDVGADVDSVRWLCNEIVDSGISAFGIDLPGHGLSEGDLAANGQDAVRAARQAARASSAGVDAVVAEGASGQLLLGTELEDPPVAAVFLDPRRSRDGDRWEVAPCWRHVPKLVIVSSPPDDGYPQSIIAGTTAWCLRADLAGRSGNLLDRQGYEVQVSSLTLKFVLEQAAFELASRRPPSIPGPAGGTAHEAAPGERGPGEKGTAGWTI